LPLPIRQVQYKGSCLDSNDVSEVVACGPESDDKPASFLGKPVSIDRYEAWKKKGIKYANEAEDHIKVGMVCDIVEAYHRQKHV
jgi:hypothetical protein